MNTDDLIAIDIHTHAEVSCWNPFDNYGEEYDRAADKYFGSNRRPTIAETIAHYREIKIGLVMFTVMTTWKSERFRLLRRMHEHGNSLEAMISSLEKSPPVRVPGTAVYMSRALNVIPFALLHNLKHNKVLHERVILLTLRTEDAPYVHNVRRVQIEQLSPSFWRVVASYGWRETPNVEEVFHRCGLEGLSCRMMETSFFMSHESLIIGKRPWYLRLRGKLYLLLQRNALRAPDQFEIPPNRVIELGTQVEI